jgi:putative lipase involved disintegration of autophagic bodies
MKNEVVLTGHSLGGGLAKIAAIRSQHVAVTFQSPGIHLSRIKFGIDVDADFGPHLVTVVTLGDVVHTIDVQRGTTQETTCNAQPWDCHSSVLVYQLLVQSCGDPQRRNITLNSL